MPSNAAMRRAFIRGYMRDRYAVEKASGALEAMRESRKLESKALKHWDRMQRRAEESAEESAESESGGELPVTWWWDALALELEERRKKS